MLAPWKKSYDKPRQHDKKQRCYFANKGLCSQGYGFSSGHVWVWELDYKKAEHQRIDVFELWCWRRPLRVPWTARRLNQSILKEISPEYSVLNIHWKDWCWSWNSNTLATWCKELSHWKRPWCWERLKAGGEGDDRGWDGCMPSLTQCTWVWVGSMSWWWTGKPGVLQSMGLQRVRHDWVTELNWKCRLETGFLNVSPMVFLYPWPTWAHFLRAGVFDIPSLKCPEAQVLKLLLLCQVATRRQHLLMASSGSACLEGLGKAGLLGCEWDWNMTASHPRASISFLLPPYTSTLD